MEFNFLQCIISNSKQVVMQKEIFKTLGYNEDKGQAAALKVLVHRLRTKTKTEGFNSPIKNVRGIGYCFAADSIIV